MLFFAISLVCILIAFIIVYAYCKNQSAKQHTYVFTAENLGIPQDGLSLSVTVQADKQWKDAEHHPNIPFGAQYNGVLKNTSNFIFKNWRTEIIFSDNIHIDSSWNESPSCSEQKPAD